MPVCMCVFVCVALCVYIALYLYVSPAVCVSGLVTLCVSELGVCG